MYQLGGEVVKYIGWVIWIVVRLTISDRLLINLDSFISILSQKLILPSSCKLVMTFSDLYENGTTYLTPSTPAEIILPESIYRLSICNIWGNIRKSQEILDINNFISIYLLIKTKINRMHCTWTNLNFQIIFSFKYWLWHHSW